MRKFNLETGIVEFTEPDELDELTFSLLSWDEYVSCTEYRMDTKIGKVVCRLDTRKASQFIREAVGLP